MDIGKQMSKTIFVSIPRTGTRSLRQTLAIKDPYNHRTAVWIRNKIGQPTWDAAFTFAFVRNPFDKLVSWYAYHKTPGNCPPDKMKIYAIPFNDWVLEGCQHHWLPMATFGTRCPVPDPHSCSGYVLDEKQKLMVDFVGRVEHMERDYKRLCSRLDLGLPPLKHVNRSGHQTRREMFSAKAREYVECRFARDLKLWGYVF